jgi:seryl-tRNA synthetase
MLDRKIIRDEPDRLREAIRNRGSDFDVDELIRLDERRRELLEVEQLKAERNSLSKEIGAAIQAGGDAADLKARVGELKDRIAAMEEELGQVDTLFDLRMLDVPNMPLPEVPIGAGEDDNVVVHERGAKPSFDFDPRGHWEVAERLGILDFGVAAKIAGARFACDFGAGAQLERSLMNLMLDTHTRQHGYTEVLPPFLANAQSLIGTGSLPKFEEDLFKTTAGYYLIPTAEVPLTNIHQGEILEAADLPKYYTAYTPCFRSEAGAAGRESRGLIRLHQFNKVELMKFTTPETANDELEKLTQNAETILELLGLAHRRIILCTGDMGFGSERTFDLEVWMPGMGRWVEISSCSQYGEFQARRCETRYRPEAEGKPVFVHTMNGSGLAIGRCLAAILENYQQANGTVVVPEVLRPYMGGRSDINPPTP